ncbi:MAG: AAA family ATPase, partial [Candidatus Helarchaeota archaeon]
ETRKELTGTYEMVDEENTWQTIEDRVAEELQKEKIVILDSTNYLRSYRKRFISLAKYKKGAVWIIFLQVRLEIALKRNQERNHRQVPEEIITEYFEKIQLPTWREHLDDIIYIDANESLEKMYEQLIRHWRGEKNQVNFS